MQALTNIANAISSRFSSKPNTSDPVQNTVVVPHDNAKLGYVGRMELHADLTPLPLTPSTKEDLTKVAMHFVTKEAHPTDPSITVAVTADNTFDKAHYSYPYYLFECFANHYGAVITPDVLWFTALISFAKYAAANSEKLRGRFVDFAGNREIAFLPESTNIDDWLSEYLVGVRRDLKVDPQLLFPNFSTSTVKSRIAMQVAVCDLVSPYFTGMILSCGIPHIKVEGAADDYAALKNAATGMADHFKDDEPSRLFFSRIAGRADSLVGFLSKKNDGSFVQDFFLCKNCSSGHPTYKVSGWITEFMTVGDPRGLLLKDYGLNCAMVKFNQQNKTTKLACLSGVFNSTYDQASNTLHPQFDRFWIEYNPNPNPSSQSDEDD